MDIHDKTCHTGQASADIGALATEFHSVDDAQAVRVVRDLYGLRGTVQRMETEKDDTFRFNCDDGRRYVLKIANPGESLSELDLQVQLLRHVARVDPALPVPQVIPARDGEFLPVITDASGAQRRVRVMSFLEGTVLDTVQSTAAERGEIGRQLGRLRVSLAGFHHPGADRYVAWDVRRLPDLGGLLRDVTNPDQRRLLQAGFDRFGTLFPRIMALPCQVLHNDFSRSNIVLDRSDPGRARVSGIIDFGDVVQTAVAVDVATAVMNQFPRALPEGSKTDLFADGRDLLAGYLSVAPLSAEELRLIPHLAMGRVVTRAILTLWRARKFPENSRYILRNTEQGWDQLDWFLSYDVDTISTLLL